MNDDERFFLDNAPTSWNPETETMIEGAERGAKELAKAESDARAAGVSFEWRIDDEIDSSDFDSDPDPWKLWVCLMHAREGEIMGSLGGVDFGRDGTPWAADYRRVVEAELALEWLE